MYKYELLNNHYIVHINNKKYLIDTGSNRSFPVGCYDRSVVIDGKEYPLQNTPPMNINKLVELVGCKVDGFIGTDIISRTSLTIYKNGTLEFKNTEVGGRSYNIISIYPLLVRGSCNGYDGNIIIDTGAKYGYGQHKLFANNKPIEYINDYNPGLGNLNSDLYRMDIKLGGDSYVSEIGDNRFVESGYLIPCNALLVTNITTLFEEVCVIDITKDLLIVK